MRASLILGWTRGSSRHLINSVPRSVGLPARSAHHRHAVFSTQTFNEVESSRVYEECGALRLTLTVTSKDTAAARSAGSGSRALRLDAFLAVALASGQAGSRSKAQAAIRSGGVTVNGKIVSKASTTLTAGDTVHAVLEPAPLLQALPEPIPLDIVYEDEYLMVINKPAGMAVHVSAGHHTQTLVNALLHHCGLPGVHASAAEDTDVLIPEPSAHQGLDTQVAPHGHLLEPAHGHHMSGARLAQRARGGTGYSLDGLRGLVEGSKHGAGAAADSGRGGDGPVRAPSSMRGASEGDVDLEGGDDGEEDGDESGPDAEPSSSSSSSSIRAPGVLRPGIVHRLDLGTSGLIVVAKREAAQRHLAAQFKARTVSRVYTSITLGCPKDSQGRVLTNIDRDASDRKRMAAYPYGGTRGRVAASNYRVLTGLAAGGAALVEWKLDTGRTHQIRVHARHIGHSLLCDATYGGGGAAALSALARNRSSRQTLARRVLAGLTRPALHARTLAFDHPATGKQLAFEVGLPKDMLLALELLEGTSWD